MNKKEQYKLNAKRLKDKNKVVNMELLKFKSRGKISQGGLKENRAINSQQHLVTFNNQKESGMIER